MEIWKDIKGFEGYQVSNEGRIRTHNKTTFTEKHGIRHWKDRILKQKTAADGAMRVDLWNKGKYKTLLVHRIVIITFLGEPPEKNMTVNHKDGNRKNNHIDNLEWLSLKDNIIHGFKNGLYAKNMRSCKLIDADGKEHTFKSITDANKFLNRGYTYIHTNIQRHREIKDKAGNVYIFKE